MCHTLMHHRSITDTGFRTPAGRQDSLTQRLSPSLKGLDRENVVTFHKFFLSLHRRVLTFIVPEPIQFFTRESYRFLTQCHLRSHRSRLLNVGVWPMLYLEISLDPLNLLMVCINLPKLPPCPSLGPWHTKLTPKSAVYYQSINWLNMMVLCISILNCFHVVCLFI